jgi:hypothetical protein
MQRALPASGSSKLATSSPATSRSFDAEREAYLRVSGCFDLVGLFAKRSSGLNALRLLAYPLVRLRSSLRQLIVVVGVKVGEPKLGAVERWG